MACNDQTEEISKPGDDNSNQKESNNAPQTSAELNLPDETANNMNDLKMFDFNSADEVRQRMKAVLAGNGSKFDENAVDYIAVDVGDQEQQRKKLHLHLMSKLTETDDLKLGHKEMSETKNSKNNNNTKTSRRRPGRPPKAGPSKKLKKQKVSTLYWGKLSNVVFLRRNGGG